MIFNGANKAKEVERKQELCTPERTEKDCSGLYIEVSNTRPLLQIQYSKENSLLSGFTCVHTLHSRKHLCNFSQRKLL